MDSQYDFLLIEDNKQAAQQLISLLKTLGLDSQIHTHIANDRETVQQLFQNSSPHLTLCSWELQANSETDFLEFIKEQDNDIPFIFISNSLSKDQPAAAIRAGAADFLLKDNHEHLKAVINRELKVQKALQHKQHLLDKAYELTDIGTKELQESLERYNYVSKATNDMIYDWDIIADELYWGEGFKSTFVFEPLNGKYSIQNWYENLHPDDRIKTNKSLNNALENPSQNQWEAEYRFAKNNGSYASIYERGFIIRNDRGKAVRMIGSLLDITERKKTERKLRNAEQKLREIIEHSTNMFYKHDVNHVLSYVSPQCEDFLGYDTEESKQRWTSFATDHPINMKGYEHTQRAIDTGKRQPPFELQLQKKDGEIIWVQVNEAPIIENGETVSIVGSLTDITDRKQYEEKLEELSLVASKTTDAILITDADAKITWVNTAFEQLTGYVLDEIVGEIPQQLLFGPDTDQSTVEQIRTSLTNKESDQAVICSYSKQNEKFWLDVTIDPIYDDDSFKGFIAIGRDVTEQIKRRKELRASVERYDIVTKATSDTIWDLDLTEDTIRYNINIYNMFGYKQQQVTNMGRWWRNKIHPDDREKVFSKIEEALSSKPDRFQLEYRFLSADGSYKYIYDRAFLVTDEDGNPVRIIGAMQDMTPFKEREQRNQKFQKVISDLATDRTLPKMDLHDALTKVLKMSAETLELPRVNAWLLEDDILNCASSYESGSVNGMRGELLEHDKYPRYFEELVNNRMIISNKAQEDERLKELWDTYLIPNNIHSLLDTTIQNSGTVQIIVCHESVGEEKKWQPEEIAFAGAITDQVARLLANHEKKRKEQEIRESLKEKETLLMEVHHRVKNNLAVVSGMMQLQAFDTENEELRQKLYDSVMRIKSMATIHELLYQSKHFSKIKLDENIKRLVSTISDTYQTGPEISINYNMEPVVLNMNQAIPASLIINEVVTNSLKHAFGNNENGNIVINLFEQKDLVHLEITDDGMGLDQNMAEKLSQKKSLGIKLIDTLSEQIDGNYEYTSPAKGTKFTLTIPKIDLEEINKTKLNWSIK